MSFDEFEKFISMADALWTIISVSYFDRISITVDEERSFQILSKQNRMTDFHSQLAFPPGCHGRECCAGSTMRRSWGW